MPINIKNNKYLLIVFGEHPKLILHNLQYNLSFQERLCEICLTSQREDFREVPQNLSTSHSEARLRSGPLSGFPLWTELTQGQTIQANHREEN